MAPLITRSRLYACKIKSRRPNSFLTFRCVWRAVLGNAGFRPLIFVLTTAGSLRRMIFLPSGANTVNGNTVFVRAVFACALGRTEARPRRRVDRFLPERDTRTGCFAAVITGVACRSGCCTTDSVFNSGSKVHVILVVSGVGTVIVSVGKENIGSTRPTFGFVCAPFCCFRKIFLPLCFIACASRCAARIFLLVFVLIFVMSIPPPHFLTVFLKKLYTFIVAYFNRLSNNSVHKTPPVSRTEGALTLSVQIRSCT